MALTINHDTVLYEDGPAVIGFDPGAKNTGYAVLVALGEKSVIRLAAYGVLGFATATPTPRELEDLRHYLSELLQGEGRHWRQWRGAAIERPLVRGPSQRETWQTVGIIKSVLGRYEIPAIELHPKTVKKRMGHGDLKKPQMREMFGRIVGGEIKNPHAADAACVAVAGVRELMEFEVKFPAELRGGL